MRYEVDEQKKIDGAHEILKEAINDLEGILDYGIQEHLMNCPKNSLSSVNSFTKYMQEKFSEVYMNKQETMRGIIELRNYFEEANKLCYDKLNEYILKSRK